jgi:hypothetical protein
VARRSRDRMTLCTVYTVHKEHEFLGLATKPRLMVSPDFASKLVASGFLVWTSKPTATV